MKICCSAFQDFNVIDEEHHTKKQDNQAIIFRWIGIKNTTDCEPEGNIGTNKYLVHSITCSSKIIN